MTVWPSPADVRQGVQYGPVSGTEYVGAATSLGALVFAGSMTVLIGDDELFISPSESKDKPLRQVAEAKPAPDRESKRIFVTTREDGIIIASQSNNLTVVEVKK